MPQHVISETVADYEKYKKAKFEEAEARGWLAFVIVMSGLCGLWWWLQP